MRAALTSTLTIRLPGPVLRQIRRRARSLGVTPSELVRKALEDETGAVADTRSALELTRRWVGAIRSTKVAAARSLDSELAGWRPDRRE
ncbi:MAG TPA: hypothetical protein VGI10_26375 [Polyangiaceae bacterium]